jgi:hypothetical protein
VIDVRLRGRQKCKQGWLTSCLGCRKLGSPQLVQRQEGVRYFERKVLELYENVAGAFWCLSLIDAWKASFGRLI